MKTKKTTPASQKDSYHHGNLHQTLITEGVKLLKETNKPDISLRELSRRIGVSANAAYRHFATKEQLLDALATHGFEQMHAMQSDSLAASVKQDSMVALGLCYIKFVKQNPALYQLMLTRLKKSPVDQKLVTACESTFDTLRQLIAKNWYGTDNDKQIDEQSLAISALFAWSLVHGISQLMQGGQLDHYASDPMLLAEQILSVHNPSNHKP